MPDRTELQFLALLVHRGHLERGEAEAVLPRLKEGVGLDDLLVDVLEKDPEWVRKMHRTNAGETPEIPGYQVLGRVGTGGTADVFRVRDKKAGDVLALKVLNRVSTLDAATRKAFIAEARLLERLDHPSLVGGYGIARSGETYFSKLEFVEGATLLEILDRGQALEEDAALRIVVEVAEALRYLHKEGVIHRDVKPGNIMLTGRGKVKLIDLGFAAGENSTTSSTDSAVGTVAYLSPEQARGGAAADLRSDIYSLGVTLFHLVIGRLPFESSDDREVLRMQVMESLSSPELKGRDLSPHLHYFVEKMMAKDKDVRYQSWEELVEDVRSQLQGRDSLDYTRQPKGRSPHRRGPHAGRGR